VAADDGVVSVPHSRHDARHSNHLSSRWLSQALEQRLVELYQSSDDLSFAEIAWRLNDEFSMQMSRNAVIGRAHRMQLPPRVRYRRGGRPVKIAKKPKVTFKARPKPAAPGKPRDLPLLQLKHHQCRFATAGTEAPYLFCAEPTVEGRSWCPAHNKIVRGK
jgi:hypothetical protein